MWSQDLEPPATLKPVLITSHHPFLRRPPSQMEKASSKAFHTNMKGRKLINVEAGGQAQGDSLYTLYLYMLIYK